MTLLTANDNNNTISTAVATVAPDQFQITTATTAVAALNGNDTITLTTAYRDFTIQAGNGNDSVILQSSLIDSEVYLGNGNDTTIVSAGASVISTYFQSVDGNNLYQFNANSTFNSITGGLGADTVAFVAATSTDDDVLLGQNGDTFTSNATITRLDLGAGQGNDTITVNDGAGVTGSEFRGAKDNDSIVISGAVTNSTLRGGDGNDTITTSGLVTNSLIIDTLGTANFVFGNASSQATITGGTASDTITLTTSGAVDSFFANSSAVDVLTLAISGATADSSITAGGFAQAAGINRIVNNSTDNGQGAPEVFTINATGFSNGITIVGAAAEIDNIAGGVGNDTINTGGQIATSADEINSGNGADLIDYSLSSANNILSGNADADTIIGGIGNDVIAGGTGADTMTGTGGSDEYLYSGNQADGAAATGVVATGVIDVITDFTGGNSADSINMSVSGGNNAFVVNNSANGNASYSAALAAADAAIVNNTEYYNVQSYGSGNSWTAVLFMTTNGGGDVTGAIQLGATGAFTSAALANQAIVAGDIV